MNLAITFEGRSKPERQTNSEMKREKMKDSTVGLSSYCVDKLGPGRHRFSSSAQESLYTALSMKFKRAMQPESPTTEASDPAAAQHVGEDLKLAWKHCQS